MGFLLRLLANGLAILLAAHVVPGIRVDGLGTALIAGVVLGLINAIVRPILVFITFPITLLTLGLFLLVLNAFCFWLASYVVNGFHVSGFFAALLGSLVVTVVSWVTAAFDLGGGLAPPFRRS